jgi:hypothetical protein
MRSKIRQVNEGTYGRIDPTPDFNLSNETYRPHETSKRVLQHFVKVRVDSERIVG